MSQYAVASPHIANAIFHFAFHTTTQFPVELVERCVLAMTNEDDWVLDPFAGVGSSLIAAIRRNRRAMGSEKELKYVEVAQNRIIDYFAGRLKIRPLGKPVFQPSGKEKVAQFPQEWQTERLLESRPDWESDVPPDQRDKGLELLNGVHI